MSGILANTDPYAEAEPGGLTWNGIFNNKMVHFVPPTAAEDIAEIMRGAIDMHIHHAPDPSFMPWRVDCYDVCEDAIDYEMRGVVLKGHAYNPAPMVEFLRKRFPQLDIFAGTTLDYEITGGYNLDTIEGIFLGPNPPKVLWWATQASDQQIALFNGPNNTFRAGPLHILDDDGNVLPAVKEVLDLLLGTNIEIQNGHLSPKESYWLFKTAYEMGHRKLVVTHPLFGLHDVYWPKWTVEQMKQATEEFGCKHEMSYADLMFGPQETAAAIQALGAENIVIITDAGAMWMPRPAEAYRCIVADMLLWGIPKEDLITMCQKNPAQLLDLE